MRRIRTRTAVGALAFAGVLGAGAVAGAMIGDPGTSVATTPTATASALPADATTDGSWSPWTGAGADGPVSLADLVALVEDLGFDPADVVAAAVQGGSAAEVAAALGIERDVLLEALDAAATAGIASLRDAGRIDAGLADGLRAQLPVVLPFLVDVDPRAVPADVADGTPSDDAVPHEVPEELEALAALGEHADGVAAELDPAAVRAAVLAGTDAALDVLVHHGVVPAPGADAARSRLPGLLDAVVADVAAAHGAEAAR